MIAKILSPATSFAGIDYNEKKNEEGRSELLVAENFDIGIDNLKKSDYVAYMDLVCRTNPRVKNIQFHATISCKGREYSADQLKDIALQYVEKMGYSKNPFIIYFHSDTDNNHVHIVSTRVQKDGKKVNDKMERVRSQKIINEIMNIDLKDKVEKDISKSLEYSFSSTKQYKLLMEGMGWKVGEKDGNLILSRGGERQGTVPLSVIQDKQKQYSLDDNRKKQITALLYKYKEGLSYLELKTLMKNKFGIDLIFHTGINPHTHKLHTTPYGFTIIDHSSKTICKGGEIMDMKELLSIPNKQAKVENCNDIINAIFKGEVKHSMESFKSEIAQYGYKLSMDGKISLKGTKEALLVLDKSQLKELRYNSRVNEANKYNVSSSVEAALLAKIYFIRASDVFLKAEINKTENYILYAEMMKSYLANSSDIRETLQDRHITFIEDQGNVYLIDKQNKNIVSASDLGLCIEHNYNDVIKVRPDNMTNVNSSDIAQVQIIRTVDIEQLNTEIETNSDLGRGNNMIDVICDILSHGLNTQSVQQDRRRKKRRGQQQN